jgi:hypothetical protein
MHKNLPHNASTKTLTAKEYNPNPLFDSYHTFLRKLSSLDIQQIKIYLSVAYFILVSLLTFTLVF